MEHLKLVVLAEVLRAERYRAAGRSKCKVKMRPQRPQGLRGVERTVKTADRIVQRFTRERPGWSAESEAMKHLRLVVVAELVRAERDGISE